VAAAVVLRPGTQLNEEELRNHCRSRLAAYKVPRQIVAFPALPVSMLGKVLRKQVRDRLLAR
jgi:long-chain acyl-CoA synthetase